MDYYYYVHHLDLIKLSEEGKISYLKNLMETNKKEYENLMLYYINNYK